MHRTYLFQKNCVSYLCHRTNARDKIINFIYNFALLLRVPFKAFGTCLQLTIKTVLCFSVHCRIVNFEFTYMRIWLTDHLELAYFEINPVIWTNSFIKRVFKAHSLFMKIWYFKEFYFQFSTGSKESAWNTYKNEDNKVFLSKVHPDSNQLGQRW